MRELELSCKHCGCYHPVGYTCEQKPKLTQRKKRGGRREDRFRGSPAWQRKREWIRARDHYMCRICLEIGLFVYGGIEVHHIIPLAEDWDKRLDDENLISLCGKHHEQAERGRIRRDELHRLADSESTPRGIG